MKLSEYREKLEQNPEYIEAEKKLRVRFVLGNAVMRARMKRGWSQTDLAEAVGTKQANISQIEAGLANPTLDLIQRLCETLNLELNLMERGKETVAETVVNDTSNSVNTTTETLEHVDDQPDNLFCRQYTTSSIRDVQEGTLQ